MTQFVIWNQLKCVLFIWTKVPGHCELQQCVDRAKGAQMMNKCTLCTSNQLMQMLQCDWLSCCTLLLSVPWQEVIYIMTTFSHFSDVWKKYYGMIQESLKQGNVSLCHLTPRKLFNKLTSLCKQLLNVKWYCSRGRGISKAIRKPLIDTWLT